MGKVHMLALGGDRGNNGEYRDLYPQGGAPHPDYPWEVDIRKACVRHSITSHVNPDEKRCNTSPLQIGIPGQGTYFRENPPAVGDVIAISGLPKFSSVHGIWWLLRNPVPGLVVSIGLQACAHSLNPNGEPRPLSEIGLMVREGLDLSTTEVDPSNPRLLPSGFECIQGAGNKPGRYLDQNDMVLIRIDALPDGEDFNCLDLVVSPVVDVYCHGDMAAMSKVDEFDLGLNRPTRVI